MKIVDLENYDIEDRHSMLYTNRDNILLSLCFILGCLQMENAEFDRKKEK